MPNSRGVGTYFDHLSRCLAQAGVEVEVFTVGHPNDLPPREGVIFHHLGNLSLPYYRIHVAEALAARHKVAPFDVIESIEINAEGQFAAQAVPDAAWVVRMHSPLELVNKYLDVFPSIFDRLKKVVQDIRISIGAWRRGLPIPPIQLDVHLPKWSPIPAVEERNGAAQSDLLIVMSEQMRLFARDHWWVNEEKIVKVPNPLMFEEFIVNNNYRNSNSSTYRIAFLGGLEMIKGIIPLSQALKKVFSKHTNWEMLFAGKSVASCVTGIEIGKIAKKELAHFGSRVQFIGPIDYAKIPEFFASVDVLVFPSLWETFSYVALEAAASGKAIIGSRTGAIPDFLDQGRAGILVNPGSSRQLAAALNKIMLNPDLIEKFGNNAREHVLKEFNPQKVTGQIIDAYKLAMQNRDRRLS